MANFQNHNPNLEPSNSPDAAQNQLEEEEVLTSYCLRDREMLRKRKEKAQEENAACWIYREPTIKKARKTRRDKKRLGEQLVAQVKSEAELKVRQKVEMQAGPSKEPAGPSENPAKQLVKKLEDVQPKPNLQKTEPVVPPESVQQEQLPVVTTQGLDAGMAVEGTDGELATSNQDAMGAEEQQNLTEAVTPHDLNAPPNSFSQYNEDSSLLF